MFEINKENRLIFFDKPHGAGDQEQKGLSDTSEKTVFNESCQNRDKLKNEIENERAERECFIKQLLDAQERIKNEGKMTNMLQEKFMALEIIFDEKNKVPMNILRNINAEFNKVWEKWIKQEEKFDFKIIFSVDLEKELVNAFGKFDEETIKIFNILNDRGNKKAVLLERDKETVKYFENIDINIILKYIPSLDNIHAGWVLALLMKNKIINENQIDEVKENLKAITNEGQGEVIGTLINNRIIETPEDFNDWINGIKDNLKAITNEGQGEVIGTLIKNGIIETPEDFNDWIGEIKENLEVITNEWQVKVIESLIYKGIIKSPRSFNELEKDNLEAITNDEQVKVIKSLIDKVIIKSPGNFNELKKDNLEAITNDSQKAVIEFLIYKGIIKNLENFNKWIEFVNPKFFVTLKTITNDSSEPQLSKLILDPAFENFIKIDPEWISKVNPIEYKFKDKNFSKEIPNDWIPSWQIMIARNLFFKNMEVNETNVQEEIMKIFITQKEYENIPIFANRNILYAAHNEVTSDNNKFGKEATKKALEKQAGKPIDFNRPEKTLESLKETKKNVLEKISTTKPPFTFIFDGHGGEDALYFSDGQIPEINNQGPNQKETKNTIKITLEELNSAYVERCKNFPELSSLDPANKDIFILTSCYNHTFIRNFYDLLPENMPKPIFIGQSEYGQFGYGDYSDYGNAFFEKTLNLTKEGNTTFGDLFEGEFKNIGSNPSCYIFDNTNTLMQVTENEEGERDELGV